MCLQALFLTLYKKFSNVLMDRLPDPSKCGKLRDLKSIRATEEMAAEPEESSAMEMDNEDEKAKKRSHHLHSLSPFFSQKRCTCSSCSIILCSFFFFSLSQTNGGNVSTAYNVGEKEQWCLSTLGYVKAFSRQYASEVNWRSQAIRLSPCLFLRAPLGFESSPCRESFEPSFSRTYYIIPCRICLV